MSTCSVRCAVDGKFVPKVGMIFKTLEEAGKFYKHYSKLAGFSTKIRNTTRDRDKIKNQLIIGQRCSNNTGISMFVRRTIETNEEAGIRPSKTYKSFVAATSSHRELSFIKKDMKNYITREVRNISEEDDAKEFGKYLLRMKDKNQNFSLELNLEGNHYIKHALWADARSWAAFEYFGDVVSFDTTYNTNRYNLILGSSVGVNHHGKAPKGILTDQCASIQRTIELCMPTIIHRWCIWHIMKKIPNKLNGYKGHEEIEQEMSHVVWNSYIKDAFDRNWNDFLTMYGHGGNKWLSELYEDRHIWIPVYLDHHFWIGMRSTQRSESMHSFFNKFITRNSSLR
ncbi:hypothetical protein Ahy_A09g041348 [Arachis hypogaea]|uniref:MULE transposase domain-containing protein n=1 Tax=Arachis hypogaea TaxID=3818 RepID=A0A445BCJ7_ARAHY|nr:hypothetical protein Ahy_A09g041348 [Arachis hypogaea]